MIAPTPLTRNLFRLAFTLVGIGATVVASTLQHLTVHFDIALEDGGLFTSAFFVGASFSILGGGMMLDRISSRPVSMTGSSLVVAGMVALYTVQTAILGFIAILVFGVGYGMLVVCGNALAPKYNPQNPARELTAVNLFFGLGAVIGPQLANFALAQGDFRLHYLSMATLAFLMLTLFAFMPNFAPTPKQATADNIVWLSLVPFGMMFFLYVGVEMGFSTWISTQLVLVAQSTEAIGALGISLFWAGMTVARLFISVIAGRVASETLLLVGIGGVGLGVLGALLFPSNETVLLISAFAVGFGCAPIFPIGISLLSNRYPQGFGTISGVIIAVGNSGAVVLPWIQGQVGRGLDGGMLVPFISTILMLVCATIAMKKP